MINPNFFLKVPVNFKEICFIYPPSVKDAISVENYGVYCALLTTSQEDIEDELVEKGEKLDSMPSPFIRLFKLIEEDQRLKPVIEEAFTFFIHEPVTLLADNQIIIIGDLEEEVKKISDISELRFLNEAIFFDFQNLIRQSLGIKEAEPYNPNENPKVKYFKAKARYRDKVKAKSKDSLTLGSTLAAICCMDFGLNPLNIGELSVAALPILTRYYQEKTKYDIDIKSLLAGADKKKVKPQNWIRNIEDL